jgi:hypothetical protein
MANSNEAGKPGKKHSSAAAQKLREQMLSKIAELSDDELSQAMGGTAISPSPISIPTPTPISPGFILGDPIEE